MFNLWVRHTYSWTWKSEGRNKYCMHTTIHTDFLSKIQRNRTLLCPRIQAFADIHPHPFSKSVAVARKNTQSFQQMPRSALSCISVGPVALNTAQKLQPAVHLKINKTASSMSPQNQQVKK